MSGKIDRVLLDEAAIHRRLDTLAAQITADYQGRQLTVVAVLDGALMLLADLLRRIPLPLELDCLSVSSYHGAIASCGQVTFDQHTLPQVTGRDVLLVDDILDTGLTLDAVTRRLCSEARPNSLRTCVLLRKQRERLAPVEADYVGFDIGNEFVVGYGLDYKGLYRNLPFIGVLRTDCSGE